jgi:hypothetical protein
MGGISNVLELRKILKPTTSPRRLNYLEDGAAAKKIFVYFLYLLLYLVNFKTKKINMENLSENLIQSLAHLEMAKESVLQCNKNYHLRMANTLANGEPVDADEIDLGILSIKLKTMSRNSEELISQLKIIVDKYDTQDDNVLKILLNYREELQELRKRK